MKCQKLLPPNSFDSQEKLTWFGPGCGFVAAPVVVELGNLCGANQKVQLRARCRIYAASYPHTKRNAARYLISNNNCLMKGIAVDIVFAQQSLQRAAVFAGGFGGVAYIATMGCEQSGEIIAFKITHGCRLGLAQALRF